MIERNGKFYVTAEFTDRDKAHAFDKAMRADGICEAWGCKLVDAIKIKVENVNTGHVTGTLTQIGQIKGEVIDHSTVVRRRT